MGQPHHQVRGLRVAESQQLGNVLLVAAFAHHEHQLEVVFVGLEEDLGQNIVLGVMFGMEDDV